jgi:shikimate dehydrogenase
MPLIGLIGYPLGHSFSPNYFKAKFSGLGLSNWDYQLFPIPSLTHLPDLIEKHPDLLALNVTIPYKTAVLPFCHSQSDAVEVIGASNLLIINRQGQDIQLHAQNTDVEGFKTSLLKNLDQTERNALIFGTGGASKAAEFVLNDLQIPHTIIGRNTQPNYDTLDIKQYNLFINCTPLGMYRSDKDYINEKLPLKYEEVSANSIFFDMVYNPIETAMMRAFKAQGAKTVNGLEMLHLQADAAWDIIQDVLADNLDNPM